MRDGVGQGQFLGKCSPCAVQRPLKLKPHILTSHHPPAASRLRPQSAAACSPVPSSRFPSHLGGRARRESPARSRSHRVGCACGSHPSNPAAPRLILFSAAQHHKTCYSNGARKALLNRRTPAILVRRCSRIRTFEYWHCVDAEGETACAKKAQHCR